MTDKVSFAAAYEELQKLTKEFEAGDLDLELAIPKFKRAAELAKFLKKRLTELETQIEEINLDLEKDLDKPTLPESSYSEESKDDINF